MTEDAPSAHVPLERRLALFEAAQCGDLEEFLGQYGDDEQDVVRLGHPLLLAALGHADPATRYRIAGFLLDRGAAPAANSKGFGPLHLGLARWWDDPSLLTEIVRRLIDAGADVNQRTYDWRTPSHMLASQRLTDTQLAGLYDLWFAQESLDLVTPSSTGADPVDLVRRLGGRTDLLRRMQEYRARHADEQATLRAAAGDVPPDPGHLPTSTFCLATRHVVEGAAPIEWMVREEPSDDSDSGWRFWSEEDVARYRDDLRHVVAVPVAEVAAIDPYVVGAWGLPVGTRLLVRRGPDGRHVLDPTTGQPSPLYPFQLEESR